MPDRLRKRALYPIYKSFGLKTVGNKPMNYPYLGGESVADVCPVQGYRRAVFYVAAGIGAVYPWVIAAQLSLSRICRLRWRRKKKPIIATAASILPATMVDHPI